MIKATGIIRRVDDLGQVVLPIELRRLFGLNDRECLEIFTEEDRIILRKYQPLCIFCGNGGDVAAWKGKAICGACRSSLADRDPA
ncbi:MAG TPA: AbrB/MazE/SpoVT family DNA-binding domain-containing protein [Symbiobacteriaceae bacterium]